MDALILRKVIFDLLVFLGDNNSSIFIGLALSRHATALAKPSNELEESRHVLALSCCFHCLEIWL